MSTSFSVLQPPELQYSAKFYLFPTSQKKCSKFFWSTFFVRLPKPEFWSPSLLTSLVIGSLQPEISFDQSRERQFLKWLKFFHPSFYISRFLSLSLSLSRSPLSLTKTFQFVWRFIRWTQSFFLPIWQICLPDPDKNRLGGVSRPFAERVVSSSAVVSLRSLRYLHLTTDYFASPKLRSQMSIAIQAT